MTDDISFGRNPLPFRSSSPRRPVSVGGSTGSSSIGLAGMSKSKTWFGPGASRGSSPSIAPVAGPSNGRRENGEQLFNGVAGKGLGIDLSGNGPRGLRGTLPRPNGATPSPSPASSGGTKTWDEVRGQIRQKFAFISCYLNIVSSSKPAKPSGLVRLLKEKWTTL